MHLCSIKCNFNFGEPPIQLHVLARYGKVRDTSPFHPPKADSLTLDELAEMEGKHDNTHCSRKSSPYLFTWFI